MDEERESAAGRLLVSTQPYADDLFGAAVILVLMDGDEGSHGLVLNRPLDVPVSQVLDDWQPHVTEPGRLFQGGPVGLDTAMGLVGMPGDLPSRQLGIRLLFGSVGVVDLDAPPELVVPEISGLRIFAGYSGWDVGQLTDELERGVWAVVDLEARDPFTPTPQTLWRDVLLRQRNHLSFLTTMPEDLRAN